MQTGIFNDIDEYSKSILNIRNYIRGMDGEEPEEGEELTPYTAATYSEETIDYMKKLGRPCECSRWKSLYQR